MRKIFYITLLVCHLFAYDKSLDEATNQLHFISEHFKVIADLDTYSDDKILEQKAYNLLDAAQNSWNIQVENFGFKRPNIDIGETIDIFLLFDSYSNYLGEATEYSDGTPYFVLNTFYPDETLEITVAHEFFHTIQYAYLDDFYPDQYPTKWDNNIWWLEATAVLLEDEVYDDVNEYITYYLDSFFSNTTKNFEEKSFRVYSLVIFAKFLKENYGMEIIKKTFENFVASDQNGFYEVIDNILQSDYNTSMEKTLNIFAKWISDPKSYFEEGSLYPVAKRFLKSDTFTLGKGGIVLLDDISPSWNLTTLSSSDANTSKIFSENIVWTWEEGDWKNNINGDSYSDIETLNIDQAYWVYSTKDQNQTNYFTYYDNTQFDISSLPNGWNFLGTSVDVTLEKLQDALIVWQYYNNKWYGYSSDTITMSKVSKSYNTISKINKYSGFWVYK